MRYKNEKNTRGITDRRNGYHLWFAFTACDKKGGDDTIVCYTNAFFAPFEYYGGASGTEIVGVDIDIMNKVGEKLGKKVVYENKDFATLIDYVQEGKLCDCAAAGFTITDSRKEKVNFSVEYYTSVQYVIVKKGTLTTNTCFPVRESPINVKLP